ncbi:MAG: ABC transporter substrate-binding protein, partial [Treponema sp.]|nr:ABC transporter substrate-binding protein [Treponema sp.]
AGFAAANPSAVKTILESLKGSIEWVVSHPAEAGALVEKHGMGLKAAVVAAAVGRSNYMYVPASKARPAIEALFRVFMEYSPQSIGETLPGDAFYLE